MDKEIKAGKFWLDKATNELTDSYNPYLVLLGCKIDKFVVLDKW
jgi:hypothetical protein